MFINIYKDTGCLFIHIHIYLYLYRHPVCIYLDTFIFTMTFNNIYTDTCLLIFTKTCL